MTRIGIYIYGNILESKFRVGNVHADFGCAPAVMENHGKVTLIAERNYMENETKPVADETKPVVVEEIATGKKYRIRIRKLTPRECMRLMDVEDTYTDKMQEHHLVTKVLNKNGVPTEVISGKGHLYKQAGNSIVVNVLCALFAQMGLKGSKTWD